MAKGQKKSNKEIRKPKADKGKKQMLPIRRPRRALSAGSTISRTDRRG